MLILQKPWTSQPQRWVEFDKSNSLTQGLVFAVDVGVGGPVELTTKELPISYNWPVVPNTGGLAAYISAAAATNWQWGSDASVGSSGLNTILSGATQSTVEVVFRLRSTGVTPHLFGQWNLTSGNHWLVQTNGTGLIWVAAEDAGGNRRRWDATSVFTAGVLHRLILSWQGGANKVMVLDGVDRTATLTNVSTVATSIKTNPFALRIAPNTAATPNVEVVSARVWNRGMSLAECLLMASQSPSALYEPLKIYIPFQAPAGGTNYTQSVSGVITSSGGLVRTTYKFPVGSVTSSGVISKVISTSKVGSITSSGAVNKSTTKTYSGSTTPSAALATSTGLEQTNTGSITATGALSRAVTFVRYYSSSITLVGTYVRAISITLAGSITAQGSAFKSTLRRLVGSITGAGSVSGFKFTPSVGGTLSRTLRSLRNFIGRR